MYGTKGRVPVQATFDGTPIRAARCPSATATMPCSSSSKSARAIDKTVGDTVRVTMSARPGRAGRWKPPPTWPRQLAENPTAAAYFAKLAYTHQREYVRWLEGAKKPETRTKRLGRNGGHAEPGPQAGVSYTTSAMGCSPGIKSTLWNVMRRLRSA